jgi:branched-chain amino acid transport system substrate-binding protein
MLKIGIITPFSNEFPFMARDFAEGLKVAFIRNEEVNFVHVETERGFPGEVSPLFRQLIIKDEVNLIVALLETSSTNSVKELVNQTKTPAILAGMGVRLPLAASFSSPFVFHNSFRMWESCWLSGKLAAEEIGKKIGVFSSFFDSGYPLAYAHLKGAEQSGGVASFFSVTHKDKSEQELLMAQQNLKQVPVNYYFTSYYGKERELIFNWFKSLGISTGRIVASPGIHPKEEQVFTVTSWHHDVDLHRNNEFVSIMKQHTGHEANEFSMLGYETGCLVREAIRSTYSGFDPLQFIEDMKTVRFDGPRGILTMNPKTQATHSDHYRISIDSESGVKKISPVKYPVETIEKEIESNQPTNLIGWQNSYLCK